MTQPPDWWSQLSPGIHNAPPRVPGPDIIAFTWQQLQQIVAGFVNEFLRQVAVALGAVEIFGFKPYEALVEIGENIASAKANFDALLAGFGLPTMDDVAELLANQANDFATFLAATGQATFAALGAALQALIDFLTAIPANLLSGALPTTVTLSGTQLGTLLQYLNSSGQYAAAQLTGALNTGLTFSGTALSVLLQYLNGSGQFSAAQLTGGINTAVTFGGTQLGTLLQYLNSSGQFAAGQLTGAINGSLTLGGVTLSTLVTNINSSGQILAAGITGALGTGLTVGGVTLGTLFTNINSSGLILGAGITGAINTAATVAGQTLGTIQANAQGLVQGINNAAAGVTSGASSLLADAQTNLGLLLGAAPQFLQGLSGVFGQQATNDAYLAAAQARSDQAAEQARITSAFNAVFNVSPATAGNINVTVDFSGMANAANMSGVMSPGNTNMGITSGAAARKVSTSGSDAEVFPTVMASNYQAITATLGPLNDVSTSTWTEIRGRENSAQTTFVAVVIDSSGGTPRLNLVCRVSGADTVFALSSVPSLALGGVIKLILGDPSSSSPYAMQVLYNGTPVITYTDSAHVSQLGASYLYAGLRMSAASGKFPPAIRAVTYQDNPPTPGSYPFSGLPTAGTKGRKFIPDDVGLEVRDNGSAWEYVRGGPLLWFTPPPSTSWSWVNQGGASTATELGGERITAPTSTRNWRLRVRTLTPSSNYTAVAYIEASGVPPSSSNRWYSGIVLRNSSSGSFISFGPSLYASSSIGAQVTIYRWTNATTFSASSFEVAASALHGGSLINWLRIRDDGTNRYFDYSVNGVDWISVFSEGRTTFITPDQLGFGFDNEASGADGIIRLRSLKGIS